MDIKVYMVLKFCCDEMINFFAKHKTVPVFSGEINFQDFVETSQFLCSKVYFV